MRNKNYQRAIIIGTMIFVSVVTAFAQSGATRPRRVIPNSQPPSSETPPPGPTTAPAPATRTPSTRTTQAPRTATDTTRAYSLLQQKQYEAAAKEARQIATADPKNAEAWKIVGFAELNLKQYAEAADDLQRALDLQRSAGEEDPNTVDALAQA